MKVPWSVQIKGPVDIHVDGAFVGYFFDVEKAQRFVKAANMHDEIVEALQQAVDLIGSQPACAYGVKETYEAWNVLLAKAKSK